MRKYLSCDYLSTLPKSVVFRMFYCLSYYRNLDEDTQQNLIQEVCRRIETDIEGLYY